MGDDDHHHCCAQCRKSGEKLLLCSRCKDARYCSAKCQAEHFKIHKGPCKAAALGKKTIYYFGTDDDEELFYIPDCVKNLFIMVKGKFNLERIKTHAAAVHILNDPATKIILAVTPWAAVTAKKLPLKEFMSRGGTLLCCGQFSGHITPVDANSFFQKMGFPWKFGAYCRTDDCVTPTAASTYPYLTESYSNKATRLANVDEADKIYAPNSSSKVQSMVFASDPVKVGEASAVLGKVSKGYLGYIGDVNDERDSAVAVLLICEKLLEQ